MAPRQRRRPQADRETVAYVRVSTEEQVKGGVSLEAQDARIRAFCVATGRHLDEVIKDPGISAKTTERPGFKRLLRGVESGKIGAVLVLKIDRATRSVRDLADIIDLFEKNHCAFISVTESIDTGSAAGRMITNLLGVLAQFEREQIGERTAFALAHKRQQRKVYGHTPFGWRRDGDSLVPDKSEQRAIKTIRMMDAEGASYRRIGEWLAKNGFKPRQGAKVWHAASVRKMLLSQMYAETDTQSKVL